MNAVSQDQTCRKNQGQRPRSLERPKTDSSAIDNLNAMSYDHTPHQISRQKSRSTERQEAIRFVQNVDFSPDRISTIDLRSMERPESRSMELMEFPESKSMARPVRSSSADADLRPGPGEKVVTVRGHWKGDKWVQGYSCVRKKCELFYEMILYVESRHFSLSIFVR